MSGAAHSLFFILCMFKPVLGLRIFIAFLLRSFADFLKAKQPYPVGFFS